MSVLSAYNRLGGAVGRAADAARRLGIDLAGGDEAGKPWHARLQKASFRGVPFGVIGSFSEFGRRVAVHEYPYRDSVWVEDMGRAPRRISLIGFLVEDSAVYGGGDVLAQRDRLVKACETAGEAELVHPSLGRKSVALLRFHVVERRREGRVFEFGMEFVEAGKLEFPSGAASTRDGVLKAADRLKLGAIGDFLKKVGTLLKQGAAIVKQIVSTVNFYVRAVVRLINDATALYNAVKDVVGEFGRFFGGAKVKRTRRNAGGGTATALTSLTALKAGSTTTEQITALKAMMATRRADVATAGTAALSSARTLTINSAPAVAESVAAVVTTTARAIADPADALRLLTPLAAMEGPSPAPGAVATASLVRRIALAEVAKAAALYEPPSYDDAVAVRTRVVDLIEAEMVRAGDAGDDDTFMALRELRTAVAADLTERGASLARKVEVSTARPLPALVLAHRLYQDPERANELVEEAAPIHPAFMPVTFRALAE